MTKIFIQDKATFKTTARTYTDAGFLLVPGRVAKTGTQKYLRRELGLDGDPNATVTVYRPPEEVFADDSLASFDGADITVMHPGELVNAKNYKKTSVGFIKGPGRADGDFVAADLIVKDADAIKMIEERGFVELSAGYTAEYDHAPGTTDDGTDYDYIQRSIRINHAALLPAGAARAGRQARIFDNQPKGNTMTKLTLDSGRSVEIQDEATAALVSDYIDRLKKQVTDSNAEMDKRQATIDGQSEQIEKLKAETADDAVNTRVQAVLDARTKAEKVAPGLTFDSTDPVAIQRAALAKARPTVDWAEKSDAYVQAAFDMAADQVETTDAHAEQKKKLAEDGAKQVKEQPKPAYDSYAARFTQSKE
ncbi:DUF2213 domain-containing protein [Neopusillimonas maritima]|uniref:DUF2213 domain-containing protein n=1 Tax=Neopusillimonas maritima TaxID=2026239 RepID=A0A3A1YXR4_9BURK|nr:DUF2213 domain-containing protein [Neopusillimonas maritima]RIY41958.1 hypothetical protein CJP73_00480 [Neopusillimonas maritima]